MSVRSAPRSHKASHFEEASHRGVGMIPASGLLAGREVYNPSARERTGWSRCRHSRSIRSWSAWTTERQSSEALLQPKAGHLCTLATSLVKRSARTRQVAVDQHHIVRTSSQRLNYEPMSIASGASPVLPPPCDVSVPHLPTRPEVSGES